MMMNDQKIYQLKVALDYNKMIYRVIKITGNDTLDDLSDIILSSFHFDKDHLYLFNMDNVKYSRNCYNSKPERGEKSTHISIDKLQLTEKQKFLYLYDFGDEWVFRILVQKIVCEEHYIKPIVLKGFGEATQYQDYEDEYPTEVLLRVDEELKIIDILNEFDDEYIQVEYHSLFNYEKSIDGKSSTELKNEINDEILKHPERLMIFLPNEQLRYLEAFIQNKNIFSIQDKCGLMKLYSFGFCRITEDDYNITIKVPMQVIDVYKTFMEDTKNKRAISKNEEFQKIAEYLISKYCVIELQTFYDILLFTAKRKMEYKDFKYFMYSRLHYFGHHIIFTDKDSVEYFSLFNKKEALSVLEQRNESEEYKNLPYVVFTLKHCREAMKQNYYMEYPAYREWWEYLIYNINLDSEIRDRLLAVTTYAALIQIEDYKEIIKECRELFHQGGCNFIRKAERLIKALANGLPAAVEKGRTYDEYGKTGMIREGMYHSLEEAIEYQNG